MNDDERLDHLVAGAMPVTEGRVASFDLERAEVELMEEIMATPVSIETGTDPAPHHRRRRVSAVVAGLVAAVVLTVTAVQFAGRSNEPEVPEVSAGPTFGAEAIAIAESSPRLLLDLPGWEITRADELEENHGLMRYNHGDQLLQINWMPGDWFEGRLEFHDFSAEVPPTETTALGRRAVLYTSPTSGEFFLVVAPADGVFVELSGLGLDEVAFLELVGSLRTVGVDEWLSALPEDVAVRPDDRAALVDELLAGVPLPDRFDQEQFRQGGVAERPYFESWITQEIACAWSQEWLEARDAGDEAAQAEATEAMQSWESWPLTAVLNEAGPPISADFLGEIADAMAGGTLEPGPTFYCE